MARAKLAGTVHVAEQGAIVTADGDDVVGALAANALGDDGERSGFDVEQIEATAAGGLENAELRFVAGADRQRALRPPQRERPAEHAQDAGEVVRDVDLVVAVAR